MPRQELRFISSIHRPVIDSEPWSQMVAEHAQQHFPGIIAMKSANQFRVELVKTIEMRAAEMIRAEDMTVTRAAIVADMPPTFGDELSIATRGVTHWNSRNPARSRRLSPLIIKLESDSRLESENTAALSAMESYGVTPDSQSMYFQVIVGGVSLGCLAESGKNKNEIRFGIGDLIPGEITLGPGTVEFQVPRLD